MSPNIVKSKKAALSLVGAECRTARNIKGYQKTIFINIYTA